MLRVRSSERSWLHSRSASKFSSVERHDQQVEIAVGGAEQRVVRIGLDLDLLLLAQHRRDPLVGRRAVVDDQHPAAAAGIGQRLALGQFDADVARGQRAHAQLVDHHLEPRQRAHPRGQRQFGDRLGQKIVGAGFQPAHLVGRLVERRDHHHRNVVGGGIAFQPPAHFEAVHVGHHDVEQHEVALGALADRQRFLAAHGGDDVEIFRRQPRFEQLHIGRDVVDDKNAGGHGFASALPRK